MKWNAQGEAESLPYPPRDSYRNFFKIFNKIFFYIKIFERYLWRSSILVKLQAVTYKFTYKWTPVHVLCNGCFFLFSFSIYLPWISILSEGDF